MILQLVVSFDLTDIPLGITLRFSLKLADLLLKIGLDSLLHSHYLGLTFFPDSMEFSLQILIPLPFSFQNHLILTIGILESCQFIDIRANIIHVLLSAVDNIFLDFA